MKWFIHIATLNTYSFTTIPYVVFFRTQTANVKCVPGTAANVVCVIIHIFIWKKIIKCTRKKLYISGRNVLSLAAR